MWSPEEWIDALRIEVRDRHAAATHLSESCGDPRKAHDAAAKAAELAWMKSRLDDIARVTGPNA